MTELKPMSEAPRDGTYILAIRYSSYLKKKFRVIIYYDEKYSCWSDEEDIGHRDNDFMGWLPLPEIDLD
jgi:hypothetical protein